MKIRAEFKKEKRNDEIEIVRNFNDKKILDDNHQAPNQSLYDNLFEQRFVIYIT